MHKDMNEDWAETDIYGIGHAPTLIEVQSGRLCFKGSNALLKSRHTSFCHCRSG